MKRVDETPFKVEVETKLNPDAIPPYVYQIFCPLFDKWLKNVAYKDPELMAEFEQYKKEQETMKNDNDTSGAE